MKSNKMAHINKQDYVEIMIYDDGNNKYQNLPNKWLILDVFFNGDKLKLKNYHYPNIILNSISAWKIKSI